MEQSSIELLCVPFLDTDVSELTIEANKTLSKRGYPQFVVKFLRFLLGIGLWTQGFTMEEYSLGLADVTFGYALLFAFLGIFIIFLSFISSLPFIKFGLIVLGIGAVLGLLLFVYFVTDKNSGN